MRPEPSISTTFNQAHPHASQLIAGDARPPMARLLLCDPPLRLGVRRHLRHLHPVHARKAFHAAALPARERAVWQRPAAPGRHVRRGGAFDRRRRRVGQVHGAVGAWLAEVELRREVARPRVAL
eukprot:1542050-Prymnesium_polylepis.1